MATTAPSTSATSKKAISLSYGLFAIILLGTLIIGILSGVVALYIFGQPAPAPDADRAWIGITYVPLTPAVASRHNITPTNGMLVVGVAPNGPAAKAGVQQDDVITAVDQKAVDQKAGLMDVAIGKKPGEQVSLTILRDGSEQVLDITLGQLSASDISRNNRSPWARLHRAIDSLLGHH